MSVSNALSDSEKSDKIGDRIMKFMNETGNTVFLINGQRITQIENPGKEYPVPGNGCEVYFSHFPKDCLEDTLFPLFSEYGKVVQLRLLMHFSGLPKGYGYAVYESKSDANRAISALNGYILNGCTMRVCRSLNSSRLFITGLPNDSSTIRMSYLISNVVDGVTKVAYFKSHTSDGNHGYCFVDFKSHQIAIKAKSRVRLSLSYDLKTEIRVTWARPEPEMDEEMLAQVGDIYIKMILYSYL